MAMKICLTLAASICVAGMLPGISFGDEPSGGSLVFYAPFEGSADAAKSGGSRQPVLQKELKFVEGKFGKGVEMSGKAQLYYSGDRNIDISEGTIAFWGKRKEDWDAKKGFMLFRAFSEGEWNQNAFFLQCASWGVIRAWIFDETKKEYNISAGVKDLKAGQWVHVACSFKDGAVRIYLNGKEASPYQTPCNPMLTLPIVQPKELRVACDYDDKLVFNGVIDEFRIYNRALSPEEVEMLYGSVPAN